MQVIDDIHGKMVPVDDRFWISQFKFTQGQWYGIDGVVVDPGMQNIPVTNLSMGEISMKLMTLCDMTNINFRLPSPEEWEYSAHGGKNKETIRYVGSNDPYSVV